MAELLLHQLIQAGIFIQGTVEGGIKFPDGYFGGGKYNGFSDVAAPADFLAGKLHVDMQYRVIVFERHRPLGADDFQWTCIFNTLVFNG